MILITPDNPNISLNRHITRAFNGAGGLKEHKFVEVLAASITPKNPDWFNGTADAVRKVGLKLINHWENKGCKEYLGY